MASLYLARGAQQGIPWLPYEEALGRDKPILLVIGSSGAHASNVLDDESLDDPALAQKIATRFTPVRVDADERPDLDARLQPPGAPESWPLVCVLSPSGEPLAVRTHLSRQAFDQLVNGSVNANANVNVSVSVSVIDALRSTYSPALGGFGRAPKLPHAPALDFLLSHPEPWAPPMAERTLDALMQGGIHDQLAGGFHRSSTDEKWIVPHFEKRATAQAALLATHLAAHARSGEPRHLEVARGIVAYVMRRLATPLGGVYALEAADVGAYDDGSYYTWTVDEARAVLSADELPVAQRVWDIFGRGELHTDPTRNVLFVAARPTAAEAPLLASARAKLLAARDRRPAPELDRTLYVAANAHFARAALALPEAQPFALATISRLYAEALERDGGVRHTLGGDRGIRWLDDHAQLGLAALTAHRITGDGAHREVAERIARHLGERFASPAGGFFDRPRDAAAPGLLARVLRPVRDRAAASGNALAGWLLAGVGQPAAARSLAIGLAPEADVQGVRGAGLIQLALSLDKP
jgi:uncharacterized protein YyaL (SSP411 family)